MANALQFQSHLKPKFSHFCGFSNGCNIVHVIQYQAHAIFLHNEYTVCLILHILCWCLGFIYYGTYDTLEKTLYDMLWTMAKQQRLFITPPNHFRVGEQMEAPPE